MLNRKQKKYTQVAFLIIIFCLFLYQYAYQKGYDFGAKQNTLTVLKTSLQKTKDSAREETKYQGFYTVVHVADGDTIDIEKEGAKVRVRLLGINSPESVDPRRSVECYGKESKTFMIGLVTDKKVRLELDPLKPEKDEYDRVLAYVFTEQGVFVNQQMIEQGYAYEYTYKSEKYKYQENFKSAQKIAKEAAAGLWAKATCSGKK